MRRAHPGLIPSLILLLIGALAVPAGAEPQGAEPIRLDASRGPISTSSVDEQQSARRWLEAIGRAFGIDVVFDAQTRDNSIEVSLSEVGPEEAFDRACAAAGLMWVALDERSVVIAEDTPQNRRKYEPQVVQTFYPEHARLPDLMTLLRSTMGARSLVASDQLNALTVRDTAGRVALARRLIERHDRAPAILEVEVSLVRLDSERVRASGAAAAGERLPARLDTATAEALERTGRLLARPTLSFTDGEEASLELGPTPGAGGGPGLAIRLVGRLAASDGSIELAARIKAEGLGEAGGPSELWSLSSTHRFEEGEVWAISGLRGVAARPPEAAPELVILLRPRVAMPSGVRAADREALAAGTEDRLGLTRGE